MKKSVSFADESRNTSHIYDARATDILWELPKFFEKSRFSARADGTRFKKEGFDALLEDCFCNTRNDVQKCLNDFVKACGEGRGIERFVSRSMYERRKEERSKAIKAVLIGQTLARDKGLSPDLAAEQLREVSLVYCLNAKVFARRIGKADEAAVYTKKRNTVKSNPNPKQHFASHNQPAKIDFTSNIARVA